MSQATSNLQKTKGNSQPPNKTTPSKKKKFGLIESLNLRTKLLILPSIFCINYIIAVGGVWFTAKSFRDFVLVQSKSAPLITDLAKITESAYSAGDDSLHKNQVDQIFDNLINYSIELKDDELIEKLKVARTAYSNLNDPASYGDKTYEFSVYTKKYITPILLDIQYRYNYTQSSETLSAELADFLFKQTPSELFSLNRFHSDMFDRLTSEDTRALEIYNKYSKETDLAASLEYFDELQGVLIKPSRNVVSLIKAPKLTYLNEIMAGLKSQRALTEQYYALISTGDIDQASQTHKKLIIGFQNMQVLVSKEIIGITKQRQKGYQFFLVLIIVAFPLVLIISGLLALFISRSILSSIGRLEAGAEKMEKGQFHVRVPVTTNDEVGNLTNIFNAAAATMQDSAQKAEQERIEASQMQGNINEFLDVAMDIAEGDLTKRGRVTEDVLGNVVDSINLMTEELGTVLIQVRTAATSVVDSSQEVREDSEKINKGVESTATETLQVTGQIQGLIEGIRQMAVDAQASANTARLALDASKEGQAAVTETLQGMQEIRQEVQGMAKRIQLLGDRSQEIEEIVDTIAQITRQTNLLALNASVEAAGAGQSGGRFNIVAAEVRKLANTSAQATTRIANLIKTVQVEIEDVIGSMSESTEQVEKGYRVASSTGERINRIEKLAEESAQFAEKIAESTEKQSRTVTAVGSAVQQIAVIAQDSQQSAERSKNTAANLERLAKELGDNLTKFRLPR